MDKIKKLQTDLFKHWEKKLKKYELEELVAMGLAHAQAKKVLSYVKRRNR